MGSIRVFAGDCIVSSEGSRDCIQRGRVVVVAKPGRTVLVHDAGGYQPITWLARADSLTAESGPGSFGLVARAGDQTLTVDLDDVTGCVEYPASDAGVPVGSHLDTGDPLVRTNGSVVALDSGTGYHLPAGMTVLDETCDDCGLSLMRVERDAPFEVCTDRRCDPLDDHVKDRFDDEWSCPDCGSPLRILRRSGHLLAGCDAYPKCETAFSLPAGIIGDDCDCGLPTFETGRGRWCLDSTYEGRWVETRGGKRGPIAGDTAGHEGCVRGRGRDHDGPVAVTAAAPTPPRAAPPAS